MSDLRKSNMSDLRKSNMSCSVSSPGGMIGFATNGCAKKTLYSGLFSFSGPSLTVYFCNIVFFLNGCNAPALAQWDQVASSQVLKKKHDQSNAKKTQSFV